MKTSTKEDDRPSFDWFPKDWMADTGLQVCRLAARGLWIEMLNLMWLSPKRGFLLLQNSNKPTEQEIATLIRSTVGEVKVLLDELSQNKVYSVDETGTIYSRKMVDLEHIRKVRSEAGMIGMSKRYKVCYNKNPKVVITKPKKVKKPVVVSSKQLYLEFVYLSIEEFKKLEERFGKEGLNGYIERLNGYIGQIGEAAAKKKYVSHYHTILNWARKDGREEKGGTGQGGLQTKPGKYAEKGERTVE
jgi:hypothetical protein